MSGCSSCFLTGPVYIHTFSFILIDFISCFLCTYQNKFVVVFLWYLDVCSGLHVLSYSLCPLPVVCLHMCKERICWEDTEHPGPTEKALSVCVLKVSFLTTEIRIWSELSYLVSAYWCASGPSVLNSVCLLAEKRGLEMSTQMQPELVWNSEKDVGVFLVGKDTCNTSLTLTSLMFFDIDVLPFRHRLCQEDCVCVLGHYIKDLSILGRDLAKTVVLDNMPHTYPYHVSILEQEFLDCVSKGATLQFCFCIIWCPQVAPHCHRYSLCS